MPVDKFRNTIPLVHSGWLLIYKLKSESRLIEFDESISSFGMALVREFFWLRGNVYNRSSPEEFPIMIFKHSSATKKIVLTTGWLVHQHRLHIVFHYP